jgi:hypothetical protein
MADERFFIDHGTIHDRVTGRHVRTDPDFGPGRKFEEDGIEECCALLNSLVADEAIIAAAREQVKKWRRDSIGGDRADVRERKLQRAVEAKYGR